MATGIYPLLASTVAEIEGAVQVLGGHFQPPRIETIQGHEAWRHETKHDLLASYLKCVRNVSALNACLVLLKSGHVQDVYALPKIPECEEALANYVYRASLTVRVVARRLGNGDVDAKKTNAY